MGGGVITVQKSKLTSIFHYNGKIEIKTIDELYITRHYHLHELKFMLDDDFIYVNRSTIVNLNNIKFIDKIFHTIKMVDDEEIEVSRRKWSEFIKQYRKAKHI